MASFIANDPFGALALWISHGLCTGYPQKSYFLLILCIKLIVIITYIEITSKPNINREKSELHRHKS